MATNATSEDPNLCEFTCRLRGAAVCIEDGRVILVCHERPEHPGPYWVPPGGGVRPRETLEAAALRELREETGYEGDIAGVFGFRQVFKPAGTVFEVFWHVRLKPDAVRQPPRCVPGRVIREARWFSLHELQGLRVYPEAILDWLRSPDSYSVPADRLTVPPVVIKGIPDDGP